MCDCDCHQHPAPSSPVEGTTTEADQ
jgi:hypothetical protein